MKKMFTKLCSTALITAITLTGLTVKAQTTSLNTDAATVASTTTATAETKAEVKAAAETKAEAKAEVKTKTADADTTWKPQRRLWGYTFGDFYYDAHSPAASSAYGKETNYNGVPTGRNAFQFRRLYLGYDYEIDKKFKVEVLLASEPAANTGVVNATTANVQNGDNLVDNKMAFWIKNFNLRVRDVWAGTDFVVGELSTPGFALNEPGTNGPVSLSEATWGYRSIEKTITDFHKNNSYDVGAALQGTFDPSTKNYGYVAMIGNNSQSSLLSASSANSGFFKIFYGDLWGKFIDKKLYVDFYFDYAQTASSVPATATAPLIGQQEHHMLKLFASYATKPITFGAEVYTQTLANAVTITDANKVKTVSDATVHGLSLWIKGVISPSKWGYFVRYDAYNPSTSFINTDAYAANSGGYSTYDPTTKEKFFTAGLDFTPAKNIHFMPNIWFVQYKNQYDPSAASFVPDNHTLVYRATFYFVFGK